MATTIFDKPLDHDVSEKLNTGNVYNGLDQESSGYALDARQGKALNTAIETLNKKLMDSDIYLSDVRLFKYNGIETYIRLFVIPVTSPTKDADITVQTPSGFPAYNKILHTSVSFYVNGNMVEADSQYIRVYIGSNNEMHVIQSLGNLSSLAIRLFVVFVK